MAGRRLQEWLVLNFTFAQHFGWTINDVEDCLPWERTAYEMQLLEYLKEEKRKLNGK